MADKNINVRIQNKSDTSTNWAKATSFVPKKGELIFYSDLNQIKIGDGAKTVVNLPFLTENNVAQTTYVFVKVLDNSYVANTSLVPDINMGIVESAVTARVTFEAILWRNTIDNTYKITMDLYCSSLSPSCTLKPKQIKLALTTYASSWRMPSVNTLYCCASASSQLVRWGYANWWVSNLTGMAFTDMTTNIGLLNGTGLSAPAIIGKSTTNGNLAINYTFIETDSDHKNDNLSVYGFTYHVEIITNKTTL